MSKLDVFNLKGESVGSVELPQEVFGVTVNQALLAQALHIHRENQRKYTSNAKGRSEVRGGGRKPWRQKGTGRARQGSIRSPQWRGGGVVFGPISVAGKRGLSLPKKMRKGAMCSALTTAAQADGIMVVDQMLLDKPSTSAMARGIGKMLMGKTALFVGVESTDSFKRSIHNVPSWGFATVNGLGVYQVLSNQVLVLEKSALEALANRVAQNSTSSKPKSDTTKADSKTQLPVEDKTQKKSADSNRESESTAVKSKTSMPKSAAVKSEEAKQ